jgi:hypothetical protein
MEGLKATAVERLQLNEGIGLGRGLSSGLGADAEEGGAT